MKHEKNDITANNLTGVWARFTAPARFDIRNCREIKLTRLPLDFCWQARRQNAVMLAALQVLTTKHGGKKTRQDVKFIFRQFLIRDEAADAVVEATILFPIMIMIFAALVLLAVYLPTRAALQHATQFAATVLAVENSDTWLSFDEGSLSYVWETDRRNLPFVYSAMFDSGDDVEGRGEYIARQIENRGLSFKEGGLEISCYTVNRLVYKELVVTATREITVPVNLSIIRFPQTMSVTVSSTSAVQNGDEFIRNMDIAVDFISFAEEKFGITNIADSIGSGYRRVAGLMGW